jgi:hypothetical protein
VGAKYDRRLLLAGEKRNAVLDLWEVQRYGADSFGDPDFVAVYGLRPREWYAKGVRLQGRTAVECTRDDLADAIGADVAALAATAPPTAGTVVLDPFAGSGNTLYWLVRHLPGARGVGFEVDAGVFRLTQCNLAALALPIAVRHTDYRTGLAATDVPADHLLVAFVAPPWGDALDETAGLDLRRTSPPVVDILDALLRTFAPNPLLCAIQVYEKVDPATVAEVASRFDWSAPRIYGLNTPGANHGLLLGTKGWTPFAGTRG